MGTSHISAQEQSFLEWFWSNHDSDKLEKIASRFMTSKSVWTKYLVDTERWLLRDFRLSQELELGNSKELKILDIGCGPGHMAAVAKYLGHEYSGLDLPNESLLSALRDFFDVKDFIPHRISPMQPLPPPSFGKYDICLANNAAFFDSGELFDKEEWRFLIDDVVSNQLNHESHRLFWKLNAMAKKEGLKPSSDEFEEFIIGLGGQIDTSRRLVYFEKT